MSSPCRYPKKVKHSTRDEALAHKASLIKKHHDDMATEWLTAYPCGDHWHLGRDWEKFNKALKQALRVGTATHNRTSRVRKRR